MNGWIDEWTVGGREAELDEYIEGRMAEWMYVRMY